MTTITEFSPGLYSAGQPTREQLDALAASGVRTVINLRATGEAVEFDEVAHVESLGLAYVGIAVAGPPDLTRDKVRQLAQALRTAQTRGATLIHCASGNRVGAMLALVSTWEKNAPAETAMRIGRAAGMTTLQAAVSSLLGDVARRA
jgi:uncharacterized protein (TIGR01244 family)